MELPMPWFPSYQATSTHKLTPILSPICAQRGRSHTQVECSSTRLRRGTHNVSLLSHRAHEQVSSTLHALRESFFQVLGIDLRRLGFYRLQDLLGDGLGTLDGRRTS